MGIFKIDFNAIANGATQGTSAGIVIPTTLTPTAFMKNQIYLRSPVMSRQQFVQDMLGLGKHLYEIQKNKGQVEFYIKDGDGGASQAVDRDHLILYNNIPTDMDVVISTTADIDTSSIAVRIAHPQGWQYDVYGARFGANQIDCGEWFTRPGVSTISVNRPSAYAIALLDHGAVFWLPQAQVANDSNTIRYPFSLKDPAVFFTELRSIENPNYSELGMFVPLRKLRDTDYPNESQYNNHTLTFDRGWSSDAAVTIKQEYVTTSYSNKLRTDFGGLCLYPSLKDASIPYELYPWTLFYQQQALSSTGLLTNMVTTNPPFYAPYLYLKETNTENLYGKVKFNDEEFIAASCWAAKITHDEE